MQFIIVYNYASFEGLKGLVSVRTSGSLELIFYIELQSDEMKDLYDKDKTAF